MFKKLKRCLRLQKSGKSANFYGNYNIGKYQLVAFLVCLCELEGCEAEDENKNFIALICWRNIRLFYRLF